MVASKLRLRISQLVQKIATTKYSNYYTYVFGVQLSNEDNGNRECSTTKRKETGNGKSSMAAIKLEVLKSQLEDNIGTRFQLRILCFRGKAIQRNC